MKNYVLTAAIVLLSISIAYAGFQIGKSSNDEGKGNPTNLVTDQGLLTLEETAKYLSMSPEELKKIIIMDDSERKQLSVHDTYRFIPYIEVHGNKYFNKTELGEWIKYNSQARTVYE
ncbi:hypothetical protein [Neobacillus sp. D3-1R]|uniref:hypothetical protein n=1 Tax=Neobacillus sp. D3-1R TaxID=3445778 RepID=UPI003FA0F147